MQDFFTQRSFVILIFSILICFIGTTMMVPKFIDWYASPFMPQGVSCAPSIQWAIQKMLWVQIASVVSGTVLGSFIAYKFRKKSSKVAG